MAVISISSTFGAGGSVVASRVAEIAGWKVINRAIPAEVAEQLSVPLEVAESNDEQLGGRFWRLMVRSVMLYAAEAGSEIPRETFTGDDAFRSVTEKIIRRTADGSNAVIVGRAAAVILEDRADTLHVRLDGPIGARIRQAMVALNLTEHEAKRKLMQTDQARKEYVKRFYGRDWDDHMLYHLTADSTALPLDTCTRLVLEAAKGRSLIS